MIARMRPAERALLAAARTATLATYREDGTARLVPICFVLLPGEPPRVYTPLDEKPKTAADPHDLARVRDIGRRPEIALLVDRWDEDWTQLAWIRCEGRAALLEPPGTEHHEAVTALRAKYPQYRGHDLENRPIMRIELDEVRSWGSLSDRGTAPAPSAEDSGSSSSPGGSRPR